LRPGLVSEMVAIIAWFFVGQSRRCGCLSFPPSGVNSMQRVLNIVQFIVVRALFEMLNLVYTKLMEEVSKA